MPEPTFSTSEWLLDHSSLEITFRGEYPLPGEANLVKGVAFQVIDHAIEHNGGDHVTGEPKSRLRRNLEASMLYLHSEGYRIKGLPEKIKGLLRNHYGAEHEHAVDALFA
jgi:hypothetical protein